jgi:hypothetical protein
VVEDHKDVQDKNAHNENIGRDELISSIDNEDKKRSEREDAGDDSEKDDGVECRTVVPR